MCYCPYHGHAPRCPCCRSRPLSCTPCVTPVACAMVMHIVAHTLHCPHALLPTPFIAHMLCCPCPLLPTPFVAHALCHPHPLSPVLCVAPLVAHVVCHTHCPCHGHAPRCMHCVSRPLSHAPCVVPVAHAVVMHLVARAMCRTPCHVCHALCPSPVPWLCTSSHTPCVVPLVARTVCHTHHLCHGCAPHHAHHVSHPSPVPWSCTSSRATCVAPFIAHVMCRARRLCCVSCLLPTHHPCCVVHLVTCAVCRGPHCVHRASLLSHVRFWFCTQNLVSQNKNKVATHLLILAHHITADASTSPHGGGQHWCRTCRQNMSKQDKAVTYLYTESMEWQVEE